MRLLPCCNKANLALGLDKVNLFDPNLISRPYNSQSSFLLNEIESVFSEDVMYCWRFDSRDVWGIC